MVLPLIVTGASALLGSAIGGSGDKRFFTSEISNQSSKLNLYAPQNTSTFIFSPTTSTLSNSPYASLTSKPNLETSTTPSQSFYIPATQTAQSSTEKKGFSAVLSDIAPLLLIGGATWLGIAYFSRSKK